MTALHPNRKLFPIAGSPKAGDQLLDIARAKAAAIRSRPIHALAQTRDGLTAIAAPFVSYGLTEMIQCYGFLTVFVTALTLRHACATTTFTARCTTSPSRSNGWG